MGMESSRLGLQAGWPAGGPGGDPLPGAAVHDVVGGDASEAEVGAVVPLIGGDGVDVVVAGVGIVFAEVDESGAAELVAGEHGFGDVVFGGDPEEALVEGVDDVGIGAVLGEEAEGGFLGAEEVLEGER